MKILISSDIKALTKQWNQEYAEAVAGKIFVVQEQDILSNDWFMLKDVNYKVQAHMAEILADNGMRNSAVVLEKLEVDYNQMKELTCEKHKELITLQLHLEKKAKVIFKKEIASIDANCFINEVSIGHNIEITIPYSYNGDQSTHNVTIRYKTPGDGECPFIDVDGTLSTSTTVQKSPGKYIHYKIIAELAEAINKNRMFLETLGNFVEQVRNLEDGYSKCKKELKALENEIKFIPILKEATERLKDEFTKRALPVFEKNKPFTRERIEIFLKKESAAHIKHYAHSFLKDKALNKKEAIEEILKRLFV